MRHSPRRSLPWWAGVLVLSLSLGVFGCGAPSGSVSGKVYLKDKLLKGGTVIFLTADKQVSQTAKIGEDGSYALDKVPVGSAKIGVETKSVKQLASVPRYTAPPGMTNPNKPPPDAKELLKRYVVIPERYSDPSGSGLEYTVKAGSQVHDIKLP